MKKLVLITLAVLLVFTTSVSFAVESTATTVTAGEKAYNLTVINDFSATDTNVLSFYDADQNNATITVAETEKGNALSYSTSGTSGIIIAHTNATYLNPNYDAENPT